MFSGAALSFGATDVIPIPSVAKARCKLDPVCLRLLTPSTGEEAQQAECLQEQARSVVLLCTLRGSSLHLQRLPCSGGVTRSLRPKRLHVGNVLSSDSAWRGSQSVASAAQARAFVQTRVQPLSTFDRRLVKQHCEGSVFCC